MPELPRLRLVLEDGSSMVGTGFGARTPVGGEGVFNTAMAGYVDALTDPSYRGQILVATYPLIGNYGVPAARPHGSLEGPYESDHIQVQGLVVQHYVDEYSHHAATRSLGAWLREENVPGVTGIDTRTLTRKLREFGTMKGWLVPDDGDLETTKRDAREVEMREDVFRLVAPSEVTRHGGGDLKILLVDTGAKDNILRSLLDRGASAIRSDGTPSPRSRSRDSSTTTMTASPRGSTHSSNQRAAIGLRTSRSAGLARWASHRARSIAG